jgi:hypothetical protein
MADDQQQMVLVAKLVDQVSDKLKEINKAMLATEATARKAHAFPVALGWKADNICSVCGFRSLTPTGHEASSSRLQ